MLRHKITIRLRDTRDLRTLDLKWRGSAILRRFAKIIARV